jgi:hypothetical protein
MIEADKVEAWGDEKKRPTSEMTSQVRDVLADVIERDVASVSETYGLDKFRAATLMARACADIAAGLFLSAAPLSLDHHRLSEEATILSEDVWILMGARAQHLIGEEDE